MPRPKFDSPSAAAANAEREERDPYAGLAKNKGPEWPEFARPGPVGERLGPQVAYYAGEEAQRTDLLGRATLFVVGLQKVSAILDLAAKCRVNSAAGRVKKITHIYLGAGRSFGGVSDGLLAPKYKRIAERLLDEGYFVSLEVPHAHHALFKEWPLLSHERLRFVVAVEWPALVSYGNVYVKIAEDFLGSNGGVWVCPVKEIARDNAFTPWRWLARDVPLQGK